LTDRRTALTLAGVASARAVAIPLCIVLIAGCTSSSPAQSAASNPGTASTTSRTSAAPPPSATSSTEPALVVPPLDLAPPRIDVEPTFIESLDHGRVEVARVDNGAVVQVLASAFPRWSAQFTRMAMRAPDGRLLVQGIAPPADPGPTAAYSRFWRDTTTGHTFPGDFAAVSPDMRRVATLLRMPDGSEVIRQYDLVSGGVLSDIPNAIAAGRNENILGFDWSHESRDLVVSVEPGGTPAGGLYVVDRDARRLPAHPTVAVDPRFAYGSPAVLANGHVVAFEYQSPIQHNAWGGALVDIDLVTGAKRTIMGSLVIFGNESPLCTIVAASSPKLRSCYLVIDGSIDARGDEALFTSDGRIYLYDGRSVRPIATGGFGVTTYW
jgi:hypothetical protein